VASEDCVVIIQFSLFPSGMGIWRTSTGDADIQAFILADIFSQVFMKQ
jgi:hypothetical protein